MSRRALLDRIAELEPTDPTERAHRDATVAWIASGAPLYRVRKPDVPPVHLVSYVVVLDPDRRALLLVAHRLAGLWLPPGGHVEPGEDPWAAAVREVDEELGIRARPSGVTGDRPLFLTRTRTRGPGAHLDVSLWFVIEATPGDVRAVDPGEFSAVRWLDLDAVPLEPLDSLDPHMHRFAAKLTAALDGAPPSSPPASAPRAAGVVDDGGRDVVPDHRADHDLGEPAP